MLYTRNRLSLFAPTLGLHEHRTNRELILHLKYVGLKIVVPSMRVAFNQGQK